MAVPISLTNLVNLQNETTAVSAINGNNAAITAALQTVLSLDGDTPNQMESPLDMNSNQIINLPSPSTPLSPVRLVDISSTLTPTPAILSGNNVYTGNNTFSGKTTFGGFTASAIRPWVDITTFGADPTGVTDSTGAIQSAINQLSSTGGMVFVPVGLFKVSGTLNITVPMTIKGVGKFASKIQTTATTGDLFHITANVGVEIDSMAIQGPFGVVSTGNTMINAVNCQGCKFTNLLISDTYVGINLNQCTNSLVEFVEIENIYGTYGISSTNGGGDYMICNQFDIQLLGNYSASSGYGAWASSTSYAANAVVQANGGWFICSVSGTSSSSGTGPAITPFNQLVTDGTAQWYFQSALNAAAIYISNSFSNFIAFNDLSGPWSKGIFIINGDGNIVKGNTFGQNLGIGLELNTAATHTMIEGNVFSGIYTPNGSAIADTQGTGSGTIVTGNYIQQTGRWSIIINSAGWTVSNNFFASPGTITSAYAISVTAGITGFAITGNNITGGVGQLGSIQVSTGASDFYNITNNIIYGSAVSDGGSGSHKTVTGNN